MNLAIKGRAYLESFPEAKPINLVEDCGFKLSYAKAFLAEERAKLRKKKTLEAKGKKHLQDAATAPPVLPLPPIRNWRSDYEAAVHHIHKLEEQIIGYKAVINYIEHQLAAANRGTSV